MPQKEKLIFRKPRGKAELLKLLELRYQIYRSSKLKGFCPKNDFEIDLDNWDMFAHHFGIFQVSNNQTKPVGYIRYIQEDLTEQAPCILSIALSKSKDYAKKIVKFPPSTFPSELYFPDIKFLPELAEKKCGAEVSRFSLNEAFRNDRRTMFSLIKILCAIGFFQLGNQFGIIACNIHHSPTYEIFGFKRISKYSKLIYDSESDCLKNSLDENSEKTIKQYKKIVAQFREAGQIQIS